MRSQLINIYKPENTKMENGLQSRFDSVLTDCFPVQQLQMSSRSSSISKQNKILIQL